MRTMKMSNVRRTMKMSNVRGTMYRFAITLDVLKIFDTSEWETRLMDEFYFKYEEEES